MAKSFYCKKCNKTLRDDQFYGSNNLEKYPDGKIDICKKCATMFVDNWNPDTYLWILQECDVPYIPDQWNEIMAKYARDPKKVTGITILGRYLAKMKLIQWKDYRWKDTEFLQELEQNKIKQAMKDQGYGAAEIAMAMDQKKFTLAEEGYSEPDRPTIGLTPYYPEPEEDYFAPEFEIEIDLTDEDKRYLLLKWGKSYKPEEWVKLEQLYQEMIESYDIHAAGHFDTLKLVCKASLKANQLMDIGDIDGALKMSKMYDSLMKSGRFTAAQNKEEQGEFVDSIGELVELCEKQGYIERFYIDEPNDKVDATIKDMQRYTKTLIEKETNLSAMIEEAIKSNMREDENDVEDTDEIIFDDDIEEIEKQLQDEDFEEFSDFLGDEQDADLDELIYGNRRLGCDLI